MGSARKSFWKNKTNHGTVKYKRKWHGFSWTDFARIALTIEEFGPPNFFEPGMFGEGLATEDPAMENWMYIVFIWILMNSFLNAHGRWLDTLLVDLRAWCENNSPRSKAGSKIRDRVLNYLREWTVDKLLEIITGFQKLFK